ncbi:MAG: hypothetical protein JSW61_10115 [Candidatus Thorarchaeota archaeon]|nr:MAG: hypothetical protein JSW61_10115 [Candidatus Thorarchaeota archaeon]
MGSSTYKVPGGKLLKIRLKTVGYKIEKVTIMGDFFLHPEDALSDLEERLKGVYLESSSIKSVIADFLSKSGTQIIGADPADIATAIMMAV